MSLSKSTLFPLRNLTRRDLLRIYHSLFRHYGHRRWWPGDTPFEVMVGAILTQNAAWSNVEKAIGNLKKEGLMAPLAMKRISLARLAQLIRPAGYFNVKARRLKHFLNFFWNRYGGSTKRMFKTSLERLRKELLEVNGIGGETADSILLYAGGKPTFVIDAYTRRVFSRHRYLQGDEDYETLRSWFMKLLPRDSRLYNDYHAQIVQVGKDYCRKIPRCESCPLKSFL